MTLKTKHPVYNCFSCFHRTQNLTFVTMSNDSNGFPFKTKTLHTTKPNEGKSVACMESKKFNLVGLKINTVRVTKILSLPNPIAYELGNDSF